MTETAPGIGGLEARGSGLRLGVRALALARGGLVLARGISFALQAGEALVVTGPNGAGKSTLLRTLAGFLPAGAGEITLSGAADDVPANNLMHFLAHADGLKPALTVRENLDFWAAMLASDTKPDMSADLASAPWGAGKPAAQALDAFALGHVIDTPAGYLSAGQKRRVALARLLVAHRPVWLLDEPATALDVAAQGRLADVMAAHRARGGIVIAATHAPLGLDDAQPLAIERFAAGPTCPEGKA